MQKVEKRRFLFSLKGAALMTPALAGICFGQSKWEMKNPLPMDNNFTSVAHVNNQFVAVGDTGAILTSPDGAAWAVKSSGTVNMLNTIAYGNNLYVAVGNAGTIVTSPDGTTWTGKISGTTNNLNSVAFGGNQFVAVGDAGTILTSPDGSTWAVQNSGTTVNLRTLAFGNNQFVVAGQQIISATVGPSHAMILTSPDGITWSIKYHSSNPYRFEYFNSAVFKDGKFVVAAKGTSNNMCKGWCYATAFILTSIDGSTWTQAYSGSRYSNISSIAYGNSQFVAVGSTSKETPQGYYDPEQALILTSSDGTTWSETNPEAANGFPFRLISAAYGNTQFIAIGQSRITGGMYESWSPANIVVTSQVSAGTPCKATYIGNGTVEFEVTFTTPQQYVEVFARQNGLQNVAQNIIDNFARNNDGTITYKLTRSGYNRGDRVEYRFYSYVQGGQRVFTPGPVENDWNSLAIDH